MKLPSTFWISLCKNRKRPYILNFENYSGMQPEKWSNIDGQFLIKWSTESEANIECGSRLLDLAPNIFGGLHRSWGKNVSYLLFTYQSGNKLEFLKCVHIPLRQSPPLMQCLTQRFRGVHTRTRAALSFQFSKAQGILAWECGGREAKERRIWPSHPQCHSWVLIKGKYWLWHSPFARSKWILTF
jgi:hypothetical protein